MNISYIANARIPTEKAHGIQIIKMCEAFALSNKLELILPRRLNQIKDNPFSYYGLERTFKIKKLFCLDLIPFHKYLGHLGLWIESLTFFFSVLFYTIGKKVDIIYGRDSFLLLLSFFKKNLVFEAHTFPKNYFLYSPFFQKLKGIVVITQKLKDLFVEQGISPLKIFIAPDGVDLEIFETQKECRRKFNLPQDKKIVLYTGHLYGWKGAQVLAEASAYLPENVEVCFVGGTKEDIQEFSAQGESAPGGKNNIVGHRPYAEIPYWLKAADVLVLPNSGKEEISKHWTSPMKMFEYMAAKRPIVASDLPSIREILNEENAVLIEPDNPEALARGVKEVLQEPQLFDKIVNRAFQGVQEYTWQKRVEKILFFLNNLR